jgi:hypothetical protein
MKSISYGRIYLFYILAGDGTNNGKNDYRHSEAEISEVRLVHNLTSVNSDRTERYVCYVRNVHYTNRKISPFIDNVTGHTERYIRNSVLPVTLSIKKDIFLFT